MAKLALKPARNKEKSGNEKAAAWPTRATTKLAKSEMSKTANPAITRRGRMSITRVNKPVIARTTNQMVLNSRRPKSPVMNSNKPIFPIQKIHQMLELSFPGGTVEPAATVYLNGVMEYIAAEILELSGNKAKSSAMGHDTKITEVHVDEIMIHDVELNLLLTAARGTQEE